jgi:hypothetical protein
VRQQPRLHIYEHNRFPAPDQVTQWDDESIAAALDAAYTIDELYRAEEYQADARFFAEAAARLAQEPSTGVLFYVPEQSAYMSLFDQSTRAYYLPRMGRDAESDRANRALIAQIAAQERQLYALFWGNDNLASADSFPALLNQRLYVLGAAWIGNIRLLHYDVPQAAPAITPEQGSEMTLGSAIQLVGYSVRREDNLHLSLFWRALAPVSGRYTVFVHLLDEQGALVSQQDGEPVGGLRPTQTWPAGGASAGEIVQDNRAIVLPEPRAGTGGYRLAVGMYDAQSGVRLPMLDPSGTRLADDMLLIPLDAD